MIKRILTIVSCLVFLINTGSVYADTYEDVKNAFWMYRWGKVDELIRTESDDTESIETIDCSIEIDEDNIIREIDNKYLGVHILNSEFYDFENNRLTENYKKLADEIYDIPVYRGGSSGNAVQSLQLPENRGMSYILSDIGYEQYDPAVNYENTGVDLNAQTQVPEKILAALANNPDAEFIFTIDIRRTYPKETVDFMHFCTDANGSSDLARLREAWGIPNPVKVIGLEMGNELYFKETDYWTSAEKMTSAVNWYINTCKKHAEALAETFSDVKIIPCVDGMPARNGSSEGFKAWNEPVITQLAPYIDLIAVHKYYTMSESYTRVNFDCDEIIEIINSTGRDIKIALTEHSTWDADSNADKRPIKRQSLNAMLDGMKFMCAILPRDEFYCANYHNFMGDIGWEMIRTGNGTKGKPVIASIGKAFSMLSDNYGDKVVKHSVTSESIYTDMDNKSNELACVVMSEDENNLKLMLVNDSITHKFDIDFAFNSAYKLTKKSLITAPNEYSFIYGEEASDLFEEQITAYTDNDSFEQYTMPTKSFVILTLEKIIR